MTERTLVERDIATLRPYPRNARKHSKRQIKQIAASIERFGFTNPVLVSDDGEIIAGHGRVEAAKLLGHKTVPTLILSHLSAAERRAYVLADNKLALNAGWDSEILAIELQALLDLDFEVELTGFSLAEIDVALDEANEADPAGSDPPEDAVPVVVGDPVSRLGDLWNMGRHKLLCGDAQLTDNFAMLMGDEPADVLVTDPPYNVGIDGNVCGLGAVKHREFAFASGEMSSDQFTRFLATTLGNASSVMRDGAIAFVCTFYRSKHELIFVFKVGTAEHTNSFGLGETGRYRTNVWDYAGISSIGGNRAEKLAMHPTVKPVALIADAIRDCSRRGEVVLDCFGGSGSTLIAAEKTGRRARLMEYDPLYCDTIIRRWERFTGKQAKLAATGQVFEDVAEVRAFAPIDGEAA